VLLSQQESVFGAFTRVSAVHVAASAATLTEVAGIITTLAKDHLSSLLVHPGHATVGVYYLAKRHEVCNSDQSFKGWCVETMMQVLAKRHGVKKNDAGSRQQ
jgi:hypothetical protein